MEKIIYNVTVKVDEQICDEWLSWMKSKHIPDVMRTGKFESFRFNRLINRMEEDGVSFTIQYVCQDMKTFHAYQVQDAPKLQKEHTDRYNGRFVAFRTMMELLDENTSDI